MRVCRKVQLLLPHFIHATRTGGTHSNLSSSISSKQFSQFLLFLFSLCTPQHIIFPPPLTFSSPSLSFRTVRSVDISSRPLSLPQLQSAGPCFESRKAADKQTGGQPNGQRILWQAAGGFWQATNPEAV
jgi:hypothetical protein